jgi:hypothetical protein
MAIANIAVFQVFCLQQRFDSIFARIDRQFRYEIGESPCFKITEAGDCLLLYAKAALILANAAASPSLTLGFPEPNKPLPAALATASAQA